MKNIESMILAILGIILLIAGYFVSDPLLLFIGIAIVIMYLMALSLTLFFDFIGAKDNDQRKDN